MQAPPWHSPLIITSGRGCTWRGPVPTYITVIVNLLIVPETLAVAAATRTTLGDDRRSRG